MDISESKNQHRATAAATVAVVVAVAAQMLFLVQEPGARGEAVREPPDLQIDTQICRG